MIISPVAGQIVTIHSNGQTDPTSDLSELSAVTSSSPLSVQTDPNLTDKPEYLAQLVRDKRQLSALPNLFIHMERLLDQEINKVRMNLFNASPHGRLHLPDPTGDKKIFQEKVLIPVQQYPEFNFVGRILGPRGMTSKQLEAETECKIMIRGRGSMRDKQKEELHRGKPNWEHLDEDLHVLIQCEDYENRAAVKIERAKEEIAKLLIPSTDGEDFIKKKQLTELAIINGTYRDPNFFPKKGSYGSNQIPIGAPLILTSRMHQNYFGESMSSSLAPNVFAPTEAHSALAGFSSASFLPNNDSNFLQVLSPFPAFDPMTGGFLANGAQLFEYPNQSAYPIITTPTGMVTRPTASSTSRSASSAAGATISARYQPYSMPSPHLKRS